LNVSTIRIYTPGHLSLCLGVECKGKIWSCANEFVTDNQLSKIWVSSSGERARLTDNADLSHAILLPLIDFLTPATVHSSARIASNSSFILHSDLQQLPRLC